MFQQKKRVCVMQLHKNPFHGITNNNLIYNKPNQPWLSKNAFPFVYFLLASLLSRKILINNSSKENIIEMNINF